MAKARPTTVFDTGLQHLGTVYAKALLGAGEKAGDTERVLDELRSLVEDVLDRLPELEAALVAPKVPLESKLRMLDQAFQRSMTPTLLNFLKVLARRGRFACIRAVQQAARRLYNELRGRVEVQVRSAQPLTAAQQKLTANQLRQSLGREVDMQWDLDPQLIGGLVIRVGDTVYDGSVANRLQRLRDTMVAKTTQQIRDELERFALAE